MMPPAWCLHLRPGPENLPEALAWFDALLEDNLRRLDTDLFQGGVVVDQADEVLDFAREGHPALREQFRTWFLACSETAARRTS